MKLTLEDKFLLDCVQAVLNGKSIVCNDGPNVNWSRFCGIAEWHQVQPLIYEAIKESTFLDRLSQDVRNTLLLEYHRTGMRNEFIKKRLEQILQGAAQKGIEIMLLKGAVLAYGIYPRPEHRGLGDVDILIREHDFLGLRELLEHFGYRTSAPDLSNRDLPRYAQYFQQIRFHSKTIPPIEVHFRIFNTGMACYIRLFVNN